MERVSRPRIYPDSMSAFVDFTRCKVISETDSHLPTREQMSAGEVREPFFIDLWEGGRSSCLRNGAERSGHSLKKEALVLVVVVVGVAE
jgi:hypothetical protein